MDFRSDTVTKPSQAMRDAMANAEVGDDVYGDDPTVNELEQWTANETGFEAAMFTSSGTQANLLGLMAHCERGDEYLCTAGAQLQIRSWRRCGPWFYPTSTNREQPRRHIGL